MGCQKTSKFQVTGVPDLLNRYLSPLVVEGLLERVGTSLTDPNLRYRTTKRGRAWLEAHGEEL